MEAAAIPRMAIAAPYKSDVFIRNKNVGLAFYAEPLKRNRRL
jgi:hypothetical protein